MLVFPVKRATHSGKRVRRRKDIGGDEQVRVLSNHRMRVDAFGGDGDFGHQICAGKCDANCSRTAQRNPPKLEPAGPMFG